MKGYDNIKVVQTNFNFKVWPFTTSIFFSHFHLEVHTITYNDNIFQIIKSQFNILTYMKYKCNAKIKPYVGGFKRTKSILQKCKRIIYMISGIVM